MYKWNHFINSSVKRCSFKNMYFKLHKIAIKSVVKYELKDVKENRK